MNLPSIPTDNLYKFMAISGILLVVIQSVAMYSVGNVFVPQLSTYTIDLKNLGFNASELALDTSKIIRRREDLRTNVNSLKDTIDDLEKRVDSKKLSRIYAKEEVARVRRRVITVQNEIDSISLMSLELQRKMSILSSSYDEKKSLFDGLVRTSEIILKYSWILLSGGLYLMLWGFWLWWRRLQKYQDIIIKGQAEEFMKMKDEPKTTKEGAS